MFYSIKDLVAQAKDYPSVSELMIATEMAHGGYSRERIIETMEKNLAVM
ncbi:L-serine ammonia-lyase, iron-sulfur-dependent, subunit alpha, partial [Enterococcus faecalis]|nr:L-serine ammonia-lyase, iron-sulfur-dependent, subunit alpha [Enterococcus faecalis]